MWDLKAHFTDNIFKTCIKIQGQFRKEAKYFSTLRLIEANFNFSVCIIFN